MISRTQCLKASSSDSKFIFSLYNSDPINLEGGCLLSEDIELAHRNGSLLKTCLSFLLLKKGPHCALIFWVTYTAAFKQHHVLTQNKVMSVKYTYVCT